MVFFQFILPEPYTTYNIRVVAKTRPGYGEEFEITCNTKPGGKDFIILHILQNNEAATLNIKLEFKFMIFIRLSRVIHTSENIINCIVPRNSTSYLSIAIT